MVVIRTYSAPAADTVERGRGTSARQVVADAVEGRERRARGQELALRVAVAAALEAAWVPVVAALGVVVPVVAALVAASVPAAAALAVTVVVAVPVAAAQEGLTVAQRSEAQGESPPREALAQTLPTWPTMPPSPP